MILYLVRHGETEQNINHIVQGQLPGNLTNKGKQQAKNLAIKLKDYNFDQIYSSDLKRCSDTARYILKCHQNTPCKFTKELRETNFGSFQGRPSVSIDWKSLKGSILTRKPPDGESILELKSRVLNFLNKTLTDQTKPVQKILFITHGGPMRIIKAQLEGISLTEIFQQEIDNCTIWIFDIKNTFNST